MKRPQVLRIAKRGRKKVLTDRRRRTFMGGRAGKWFGQLADGGEGGVQGGKRGKAPCLHPGSSGYANFAATVCKVPLPAPGEQRACGRRGGKRSARSPSAGGQRCARARRAGKGMAACFPLAEQDEKQAKKTESPCACPAGQEHGRSAGHRQKRARLFSRARGWH